MSTQYPSDFPCVQISGFTFTVASGVIRAPGPHQKQRRVFNTMPHEGNLSFVMPVSQWGIWHDWVKTNAYKWFEMNLPSMYAGLVSQRMTGHLVRFTSMISVENVTEADVRASVSAEFSPSMIARYLEAT